MDRAKEKYLKKIEKMGLEKYIHVFFNICPVNTYFTHA